MVRESSSARWTPWRVVLSFGIVSLLADMVYEGARSMYGPLLASLGASAFVVGLVTGAGEAMALVLRLATGPMADRRGAHWSFTIVGYGLTAICVPLLAVAPHLGAAGLAFAALMILAERAGKAVRSPSKSALLADAAREVGLGRGFGIHKALDQVGAFAGPLLVAAIAAAAGTIWAAPAWLAVPGALAMGLLLVICRAVPALGRAPGEEPATTWWAGVVGGGLPPVFFRYAVAASLTTGGLVTFGIIGYHLVTTLGLTAAQTALVYAAAMLVEALVALLVGWVYDRRGNAVLYAVPLLVALVPPLALGGSLPLALAGVAVWGAAFGVQDSTIKALVAALVPPGRLASAYGVFAAIQGAMAIVGGGLAAFCSTTRSRP
ncbi:MFS transporter [Nostocoides veronense]|uniref:MFS transporter n=1 Tax=Nostocoides veronense TaxID=330836 RepID=UPI0031D8BFE2